MFISRYFSKKKPKLQIHFGGCAGKVWYILGIAAYLQDEFKTELESHEIYYSGESAGAIGALLMMFFTVDALWVEIIPCMLNEVHSHHFGCIGIWYDQVIKHIINILPRDAYKKASKYYSNLHFDTHSRNGVIVDTFRSNQEVLESICAGGYIPGFGKHFRYPFRGTKCLDGGLARLLYRSEPLRFPEQIVKTLRIDHNMFSKLPKRWHWLHSDSKYCFKIYNQGLTDARENRSYFEKFFIQNNINL